jgi:hypothetical protein
VEIQECELDGKSEWQPLEFRTQDVVDPAWRLFFKREEDYILTLCLPPDTVFLCKEVRGAAILKESMV